MERGRIAVSPPGLLSAMPWKPLSLVLQPFCLRALSSDEICSRDGSGETGFQGGDGLGWLAKAREDVIQGDWEWRRPSSPLPPYQPFLGEASSHPEDEPQSQELSLQEGSEQQAGTWLGWLAGAFLAWKTAFRWRHLTLQVRSPRREKQERENKILPWFCLARKSLHNSSGAATAVRAAGEKRLLYLSLPCFFWSSLLPLALE